GCPSRTRLLPWRGETAYRPGPSVDRVGRRGVAARGSMYFQFANVLVFFALAFVLCRLMLGLGILLRPANPSRNKLSTYECGEPPSGPAWINFNIRFYLIALVFVIFDVGLVHDVRARLLRDRDDANGRAARRPRPLRHGAARHAARLRPDHRVGDAHLEDGAPHQGALRPDAGPEVRRVDGELRQLRRAL